MVTVRKTDSVEEEVIGSLLVELSGRLGAQTVMSDMEGGLLSLLDPVGPEGSLKTVSWPVPGILGLNNVKFAFEAKGDGVVTDSGTSSVHDHRVKTIESQNTEEVTRLDSIWVNLDLLDGTLLKFNSNSLLEELDVGLLHVGRHVGADDGPLGVVGDSTNEGLEGGEEGLNVLHDVLAESESSNAAETDISLSLW